MRRVKEAEKIFTSDLDKIQNVIVSTLDDVAKIVGSTLGPGGRVVAIESMLPDIPHSVTKDGVSVFRSLGASNALQQLIIEITREAAIKTVSEAGDGTTTSTILAAEFTKNLYKFCKNNPKYPPQKVARIINKLLNQKFLPYIDKNAIKISSKKKNLDLLEKVANVSVNGDSDMAKAVISAFEMTGFSQGSHITIQQLSGPSDKYEVSLIEGFPVSMGYEESIGKFHPAFINDKGKLRCVLEKPLFILFDGKITDIVQIKNALEGIGQEYTNGNSDFKNVVLVAHGFSDQILTTLAYNFNDPTTINVVPFKTPINAIINSETQFLYDLAAFTGAKIFDMNNPINNAKGDEFGFGMERMEIYRFRATVIGDPDPTLVEVRAEEIKQQSKQASSKLEKILLEERLGKLTSGIAELKIYGASVGELKEKADRAEDAVLAVRSTLSDGCLPGGCRTLINLALELHEDKDPIVNEVVIPSLFAPFYRLLENAGYNLEEIEKILSQMISNKDLVMNVETGEFGEATALGIFDAMQAVRQSLINSVSIASTLGTCGGLIVQPRIRELEIQDAKDEANFRRTLNNAEHFINEANERG
jgi:chaperonin GroEL